MTRRSLALALALALLSLALAEFVWGYRFETNDDLAFAWLMWGREGMAPQGDFFWFFRGGLGQLLSALLQVTGPAGYTWFYALLLAVAMMRWNLQILAGGGEGGPSLRQAALASVSAAILAWILWAVNFTRTAILLAYLAGYRLTLGCDRLRSAGGLLDLMLVTVAWMTRPEAALLGLAMACLHVLGRDREPRKLVRMALLVAALASFVFVTDRIQTSEIEQEYIDRQPYTNAILNQGVAFAAPEGHPLQARLAAIQAWLLFDEATFHTDFLRRSLPPLEELEALRRVEIGSALSRTGEMFLRALEPWLGLVFLVVLLDRARAGERREVLLALGEAAVALAGLGVLGVLVWMRERVMFPVVGIMVLGPLARVASFEPSPGDSRRAGVLLVLATAAMGWTWNAQAKRRSDLAELRAWIRHEAVVLESTQEKRVVLAARGGTFERLLWRNDPRWVRLPGQRVQVVPLQGWMTQNPAFHAMIDRLGGGPGTGVEGLLEGLRRTPDRFVVIGDPKHIRPFLDYVAAEYGVELEASLFLIQDVRLYRLTLRSPTAPR
jgi:hypothetical protein